MGKPNWQRAREEQERAMTDTMKRIRHDLGLSTTDREIESVMRKRTEEAAARADRERRER